MAVSIDDAYNSTYCYEQLLQGNNNANCTVEESQNSSDMQNIENQELQQMYYNSEVGNNVDVRA